MAEHFLNCVLPFIAILCLFFNVFEKNVQILDVILIFKTLLIIRGVFIIICTN